MKCGDAKVIDATLDAIVQITFEHGLDKPQIRIEGLSVDGNGSECSGAEAVVEAVANLLIVMCHKVRYGAAEQIIDDEKYFKEHSILDGDK